MCFESYTVTLTWFSKLVIYLFFFFSFLFFSLLFGRCMFKGTGTTFEISNDTVWVNEGVVSDMAEKSFSVCLMKSDKINKLLYNKMYYTFLSFFFSVSLSFQMNEGAWINPVFQIWNLPVTFRAVINTTASSSSRKWDIWQSKVISHGLRHWKKECQESQLSTGLMTLKMVSSRQCCRMYLVRKTTCPLKVREYSIRERNFLHMNLLADNADTWRAIKEIKL